MVICALEKSPGLGSAEDSLDVEALLRWLNLSDPGADTIFVFDFGTECFQDGASLNEFCKRLLHLSALVQIFVITSIYQLIGNFLVCEANKLVLLLRSKVRGHDCSGCE